MKRGRIGSAIVRGAVRMHRLSIPRMQAFWLSRWGESSLLIPLALIIGAAAALAAAGLHLAVDGLAVGSLALGNFFGSWSFYLIMLVLPMVGLTASFLVQRFICGSGYAKSLSPLILALHRKRTGMPIRDCWTHIISSALAVGLGGSAGLEAPSVLTGAAIGAAGNRIFRISRHRRTLLMGCGAAAAISAIFSSPVAGVLFAAEVLLPEFSVSALVPMIMSSAAAAVISRMLIADTQFILAINAPWRTDAVPFYFLLGVVCALVGCGVIRSVYFTAGRLRKYFPSVWTRLWAGGSMLCVLLWLFPVLRGQGYRYLEKLFNGEIGDIAATSPVLRLLPGGSLLPVVITVAVVLVLKSVASSLTVDSGGDGGIFAPSMFIGAFTGFAFARLINLSGAATLQEYNFVAVGMCGVFTAVMRAPLTGIFLIAEVTGSYILLVPLMIVSSVSCLVARIFEKNSIYRKVLAENNLLDDDRDQEVLRRMKVKSSIDRHYHSLSQDEPFAAVSRLLSSTRESDFPVLDDNGRLIGMVRLADIRPAMLDLDVHSCLLVFDVMEEPVGRLLPDDDLAQAMAQFDLLQVERLPVCSADGRFEGFLERAPIFARYRSEVSGDSGV